MRRALLALPLAPLLALALPACLSGFSEIRIARSDAASADVARLDATVPEDTAPDAPSIPEDALDATSALDVPAPPLDAPEVAVALDVGGGLDVQDAGAAEVDRVDVVTATDAGELADRVDVQCPVPLCGGRCVDTSGDPANCGACGRACAIGEACEGGRCGRWRASIFVEFNPTNIDARRADLVAALDQVCDDWGVQRHRACRVADLSTATVSVCGNARSAALGEPSLIAYSPASMTYAPGCTLCVDGGIAVASATECGELQSPVACCVFDAR